MKSGIHPKYVDATVTCACGNTFTVGSTQSNMKVDVCSKCHPFYTGQQRILDTAGRVERFRRRFNIAEEENA
jgi:large subunit ribosomal protein L31